MRLLILFGVIALCCISCRKKTEPKPIQGKTMGTTYSVKIPDGQASDIKPAIDSLLLEINMSVSTYIPNSTISVINSDSLAKISYREDDLSILVYSLEIDSHFMKNFSISKKYHNDSRGYFEPTVMPLVNYWGFGTTSKKAVEIADSSEVSRLVALTDFTKWLLTTDSTVMTVRKPANAQIDFSAVAKGYAVDCIAALLDENKIDNYMVEIGGEVRTKGSNNEGKPWSIGLSRPVPDASNFDFQAIIEMENMSLASSGNYRNFYTVGDKIYGHEINPKTGYPEINALLGVSVLSEECAPADAMATAFMVMGLEKTKAWLGSQSHMRAVLFYQGENGEILHYSSADIPIKLLN